MSNKKKTPTIYDVADRSGISISTISRVLNNPEKVNPETRAVVLDAIDKLGFVPKAEDSQTFTSHAVVFCKDAIAHFLS